MRIAIMYGQPYTTQSHYYEYGILSFISGTVISGNFALCDTFFITPGMRVHYETPVL